jgi:nitrogen fixation negative regulator NifL
LRTLATVPADSQERFLHRLMESAGDPMLLVDADGRIVEANQAAASLFGYGADDLARLGVDDLVPQRLQPAHVAHRARFHAAPAARPMGEGLDVRGLRRDGTEFDAAVSLGPAARGRVIVKIADITAHRRTQDRLRRRAGAVEQNASAVLITDVDGVIEYVNPAFEAASGYASAEVLGRTPALLKSGHTPDAEYREMWKTLAGGRAWRGEFLNRRKDGSLHWESATISPLRDEHGSITHFVAFQDDIGARKRLEQDNGRDQKRLLATFEQAAVGLAHIGPDGRWLRVNRKLCDIVGYSREELLQRSLQDITFADDLEADLESMRRLRAGEIDHYAIDKRYVRKDGSPVWIRLTVALQRQADGAPDYFISVVEDIDARKRAEQALRRMRGELEQMLALHVATQTAAAIAHDLNQPLNAIAAYAEAALRMVQSGNAQPDRLLRTLKKSGEQAQRAGSVMRELLQFLQKGETTTEAVDLNAVVQEALAIVEANGFGGFHAEIDLAPNLKPVRANRIQVEKVLVNLLRNSVEAMRDAGIATRAISIAIRTAADHGLAVATVRDTGPGLDAAAARRIFEPFFTTKPKGIGMGLAVSRALIEANGGTMWFDTAAGPGATFHFTLPFVP